MELVAEKDEYRIYIVLAALALSWGWVILTQL